jgi:hypothetical protein
MGVLSSSVCRGAASPAQNVVCASGSIFQAANPTSLGGVQNCLVGTENQPSYQIDPQNADDSKLLRKLR